MTKPLSLEGKAILCRDLYNVVAENTESFEDDQIGSSLAHLMGAVLNYGYFIAYADDSTHRAIIRVLQGHKTPVAIWQYIVLSKADHASTIRDRERAAIIRGDRAFE